MARKTQLLVHTAPHVDIIAYHGAEQHLDCIQLTLHGEAAHFPSTSNSRDIRYRSARGRRVPFLSKTGFQQNRLSLITALYTKTRSEDGWGDLTFEHDHITVLVELAHRSGRFDSHNFSKPIGDWLEHVGLTANDSLADILCFKRPAEAKGDDTTLITIVRTWKARDEITKFIAAFKRSGVGRSG